MTLSSYNYLTERALFVAFGQFFTMLEGSPVAERGMGAVSEELGRLVHFDMELRCAWTELFDNNLWARERLVSGDPRTSFSPASVALAATATPERFEQLLSSLSVALAPRADPGWSKALRLHHKARDTRLEKSSGGLGAYAHHEARERRDRARSRWRGSEESGSDGLDSDDMVESESDEMESDSERADDETSSEDMDNDAECDDDETGGVGDCSGDDARSASHLDDDARGGGVASRDRSSRQASSTASASDSGAEDDCEPADVDVDLSNAPLELMAAVCADAAKDNDHASDVGHGHTAGLADQREPYATAARSALIDCVVARCAPSTEYSVDLSATASMVVLSPNRSPPGPSSQPTRKKNPFAIDPACLQRRPVSSDDKDVVAARRRAQARQSVLPRATGGEATAAWAIEAPKRVRSCPVLNYFDLWSSGDAHQGQPQYAWRCRCCEGFFLRVAGQTGNLVTHLYHCPNRNCPLSTELRPWTQTKRRPRKPWKRSGPATAG